MVRVVVLNLLGAAVLLAVACATGVLLIFGIPGNPRPYSEVGLITMGVLATAGIPCVWLVFRHIFFPYSLLQKGIALLLSIAVPIANFALVALLIEHLLKRFHTASWSGPLCLAIVIFFQCAVVVLCHKYLRGIEGRYDSAARAVSSDTA